MRNVFSLLHPKLQQALKTLNFTEPTPIQKKTIPLLQQQKNVLIISETGSGKTESALFPVFNAFLHEKNPPEKGIYALYITPLRALNRDMFKRIIQFGELLDISVEIRHGDTKPSQRRKQLQNPPKIMITTPETLQILLVSPKMKLHLQTIKWVILDEVHSIAGSKRGLQLKIGLKRLTRVIPHNLSVIMLSASLANPQDVGSYFLLQQQDLYIVNTTQDKPINLTINYYDPITTKARYSTLAFLKPIVTKITEYMKSHEQILIFTNTRQFAEVLGSYLSSSEFTNDPGLSRNVLVHHGSLSAEERIEAENKFKNKEIKILVCTSSLELGLDIGGVDAVIQMFSPRQVTPLLQRIGRSGHQLGKTRNGIIMTASLIDALENISITYLLLNNHLEPIQLWRTGLDVALHQIMGLLLEEGTVTFQTILRFFESLKPELTFEKNKILELIEYGKNEHLFWVENDTISKTRRTREMYFAQISTIHDVKKYMVRDLATRKIFAMLDDRFVETRIEIGITIIVKGKPWIVQNIEDDIVNVSPGKLTPDIMIPSWIGELLPVPYQVAQHVQQLIWNQYQHIHTQFHTKKVTLQGMNNTPIHLKTLLKDVSFPPNTILLEWQKTVYFLHSFLGTNGNKTLSHLLSTLITLRTREHVEIIHNPYTIVIKTPYPIDPELIIDILMTTNPKDIENLLIYILSESDLFLYTFKKTAVKMGIIDKNAEITPHRLRRLLAIHKKSVVAQETMNVLFHDELDLQAITDFLTHLQTKQLHIKTVLAKNTLSPLATHATKNQMTSLFSDMYPEAEILRLVKQRLENTKLRFVCLKCGNYNSVRTIKSIKLPLKCPHCKAVLIAVVSPSQDNLPLLIKKVKRGEEITRAERKLLDNASTSASLLNSSGMRALLALAGKGIGPTIAARILNDTHGASELDFLARIVKEEQNYVRTRAFWD